MHVVNKVLLWSRDFFRFIFITLCSISTKVGSVCVSGIIISCRCFSKKFFCTFWNHLQVVLSTSGWLFRHWPGYALVIFTIASTSTMAFVKRTIVWHFFVATLLAWYCLLLLLLFRPQYHCLPADNNFKWISLKQMLLGCHVFVHLTSNYIASLHPKIA